MAFESVRSMGGWGLAFAASMALHVVVLGLFLCTRGCDSKTPPDAPPSPAPSAEARAEEAPPPDAEPSAEARAEAPARPAEARHPAKPPAPVPSPAGWKTYKVRPGDSLSRVARQFGCTVHELAKANGISPTANLRLGQTLKVKDASRADER